jgi:LysM repeat protein
MTKEIFIKILILGLFSGLTSCKSSSPVVSQGSSYKPVEDYLMKYGDLAVSEMKRTGVPASITLAQGMIESDHGRSYLAREANNHFGIKCHNGWAGETSRYDDNKRNECFRKYPHAGESFHDHSEFLRKGSRYRFLFDYKPTDYKAWAHGLKKAGYATNPDYANMIIRKIEENNLSAYDNYSKVARTSVPAAVPIASTVELNTGSNVSDKTVPGKSNNAVFARAPRIMVTNRIEYIIVKDGDTKEKLEKEFKLLKWELTKYNELENDFSLTPGQILYLQPKRDKAEPGKEYHTTVEGDTMYGISQKYGIKLKSLYEMNRMSAGSEPAAGTKIWLRGMRP